MMRTWEEAYQVSLFINEMLRTIKANVLKVGFTDENQEVDFFKNIKPQILGKLIYYNKVSLYHLNPYQTGKPHLD